MTKILYLHGFASSADSTKALHGAIEKKEIDFLND